MPETFGFNQNWMHGLGGLPREPTSLEGTLAAIPGVGSYIAYGRYLDAEAQKKRALQDETAFRAERAALGPGATPEDMFRTGARYATPADLMGKSDEWAKITEARKSREAMQAGLERIYGGGVAPAQAQAEPQPLGMGFPVGGAPETAPQAAPDPEARIAQLTATRLLYAGNQAYQSAIDREIDKLRAVKSDQPSVHVVQDKTSPTGWSYSDVKTDKILSKGAPPPAAAAQQQAAGAVAPETIKQLAERYRVDGTLPSFGWGASGAIVRAKILNEAASQAAAEGSTGEQERIRQVGLGTIKQALGQLEKNRANITAFENTAARNADLVLQESEKVDRLGSPAIDRWIQAGKKNIAGDPQVARLDLAMRTFINEYARVTTTVTGGGVTSDTARKEIESLLASKMTKTQVREVVGLAKQEMRNRLASYDDQVKVLRDRMSVRPGSAPSSIEAPTAAPSAQGSWRVTPVP
jgi:hypothetical protein